MSRISRWAALAATIVVLAGCGTLESTTPKPPDAARSSTATSVLGESTATVSPVPAATDTRPASATAALPAATVFGTPSPTATVAPAAEVSPVVEVVATGLEVPWALAFAPDGRLFFTERPGRLRVIEGGVLRPENLAADLPVAAEGEGGLMGLALDPGFTANGRLYVMYTYRQGGQLYNRISRLTLGPGGAGDEFVLLEGILGGANHDGGRLAFGPDGTLYATTGDAWDRARAQELDSLNGKILRLNADGTIPADNPFSGSPVYSYGHRNPQGLAWQPGTGVLYSTEHGPSGEMGACCHDEVNRIVAGGNYGWPLIVGAESGADLIDPLAQSGQGTWAPGGAAFFSGSGPAAWQGSLFFGALRGQHLHRLALGDNGAVLAEEELLAGTYGRIRDVAMGPDGWLYLTTSNRDGRGQPAADDDRILRYGLGG